MKNTVLLTALFGALAVSTAVSAEEATSDWSFSSNVAYTSDYYVRGLSQNFHKPAIQGGFDVEHSSGFSFGTWASNVSPNTFPDTSLEIDLYAGYASEFSNGIGWSVGLIGYLYPGASWGDCGDGSVSGGGCSNAAGTAPAADNRWDTYEANFGLSYSYFSAQISTTLGNWFGVDTDTGYSSDSKFSTYIQLDAEYPLANGWTVIGHVGHLNVKAEAAAPSYLTGAYSNTPDLDYTDYKVAIAKSFSLAGSEGWGAELAYVGASDSGYWSDAGWGGSSFNGKSETQDLADDRFTFTLSRSF